MEHLQHEADRILGAVPVGILTPLPTFLYIAIQLATAAASSPSATSQTPQPGFQTLSLRDTLATLEVMRVGAAYTLPAPHDMDARLPER